nr:DUF711 family protein [Ignavibacteriaceae bacterium]
KKYENSFVNFIVCQEGKLVPIAVKEISSSIIKISRLSFNGFDNFRVGVSLNPGANTPFFPFSVPSKSEGFSIALEITKGITELLENSINQDFYTRLERIKNVVGEFLQKIDTISNNISNSHNIEYFGLDASLAPYPDNKTSVVDILLLLGLQEFGSNGTLFFTSILTDLIKEIISFNKIKFVGFNGVMYSLLEDNLMCDANNKKLFSIDSLLAYSTVCGCGIDMIPVPGNILDEELASVIFDVAAVSSKLNKSLGVRILPIPGGEENEYTKFDMDFISNTRIMKVRNICIEDRLFDEKLIKYFRT